jgi:beta-glucosidase
LTDQNGGWSIHWQGAVSDSEFPFGTTIYEGIQDIVGSNHVQYVEGATFDQITSLNQAVAAAKQAGKSCRSFKSLLQCCDRVSNTISNIISLKLYLQSIDVVVMCVGEGPEAETPGDINDLTISAPQIALMNAINQTGAKIVLVLIEARPRILPPVVSDIPAILMAYLPSSEGGQAIAEILFGIVNPYVFIERRRLMSI